MDIGEFARATKLRVACTQPIGDLIELGFETDLFHITHWPTYIVCSATKRLAKPRL
jgi:hypothetical protein